MKNLPTIQRYINDFRRHLSPLLRPGIGLTCNALPSDGPGAILEFTMGAGIANGDMFHPSSETVNKALLKVPQRAFGGNLDGFRFSGTNVVMENNRIIFIKGEDDEDQWNDRAAADDVKRLLPPSDGGTQ